MAGIREHLTKLQAIATANGGNRTAGSPGYEASVRYVASTLRGAGYKVAVQPFQIFTYTELAPPQVRRTAPSPRTYNVPQDIVTMGFSGNGTVSGTVQNVDLVLPPTPAPSSTSGCEAADFAGFTRGNVALVQRGTCDFVVKAKNAEAAGASAVLLFNEGQPGRTEPFPGDMAEPVGIPVVSMSFEAGNELAGLSGAAVNIVTNGRVDSQNTSNVIADYQSGRPDRTVVVGAHLDSVAEGPGINDNGSGTATNLEIALQMKKLKIKPQNAVRFVFFGAEENGLLGSEHYVETLSPRQQQDIALNLNFDMLGSPNFVRFVYDGDGSDSAPGPPGSATIEKVFVDYFRSQRLASEPTPFDGRSDYGPFIAVGIPAGGLFSGAEDVKTPEQARIYGGTAGVDYDKCYHQACDTVANVNNTAIDQLSDAAAHTTLAFAETRRVVRDAAGAPAAKAGKSTGGGLFKGGSLRR